MTGVRVEGLVFGEGGIEVSEVGVEDTKERVQGDTIEILLGLVYASKSSIFWVDPRASKKFRSLNSKSSENCKYAP